MSDLRSWISITERVTCSKTCLASWGLTSCTALTPALLTPRTGSASSLMTTRRFSGGCLENSRWWPHHWNFSLICNCAFGFLRSLNPWPRPQWPSWPLLLITGLWRRPWWPRRPSRGSGEMCSRGPRRRWWWIPWTPRGGTTSPWASGSGDRQSSRETPRRTTPSQWRDIFNKI